MEFRELTLDQQKSLVGPMGDAALQQLLKEDPKENKQPAGMFQVFTNEKGALCVDGKSVFEQLPAQEQVGKEQDFTLQLHKLSMIQPQQQQQQQQ